MLGVRMYWGQGQLCVLDQVLQFMRGTANGRQVRRASQFTLFFGLGCLSYSIKCCTRGAP